MPTPKKAKDITDLGALARAAAHRYHRRVPWLDKGDLIQEAWRAILEAKRTFNAERGTPFNRYAWRAAIQWLNVVMWKRKLVHTPRGNEVESQAIVILSIHERSPYAHRHDVRVLDDVLKDMPSSEPLPDARITALEFEEATQEAVAATLAEIDGGVTVLPILTSAKKPAQLAKETGLSVQEIYRLTYKVKSTLRKNPELCRIWLGC